MLPPQIKSLAIFGMVNPGEVTLHHLAECKQLTNIKLTLMPVGPTLLRILCELPRLSDVHVGSIAQEPEPWEGPWAQQEGPLVSGGSSSSSVREWGRSANVWSSLRITSDHENRYEELAAGLLPYLPLEGLGQLELDRLSLPVLPPPSLNPTSLPQLAAAAAAALSKPARITWLCDNPRFTLRAPPAGPNKSPGEGEEQAGEGQQEEAGQQGSDEDTTARYVTAVPGAIEALRPLLTRGWGEGVLLCGH